MQRQAQTPTLPPLELLRIVSIREAARLAGVSQRTLIDRYRHKFVERGRVHGMRICDALQLIERDATTEA